MKKSILFIGINYFPELTGIGKYTADMAQYLFHKKQFDVTVITGNPYYPQWRIYDGYKNTICKEIVNGVSVYRTPVYIPSKPRTMKRLLQDALFFVCSFLILNFLLFKRRKYDYVFLPVPPFTTGFLGLYYRFFFRKTKIIYHIQDLQIDAANNLGMIKQKGLINFLFMLESFILTHVDFVSTISEGMLAKIKAKSNKSMNTILFPNWINNNEIFQTESKSLIAKYSWMENKKVILYSGAIGEKQGLEVLVDAANYFKEDLGLCFIIAGEGPYKEKLSEYANKKSLRNVHFLNLLPTNEFNEMLNAAYLHIIIQKESGNDLFLPSKLTNILGIGGATIVTASPNTSLYNIFKLNNCGYVIPTSNFEKLCEAIQSLKSDSFLYNEIRTNALTYAKTYLYQACVIDSFLNKIQ